MLQAGIILNDLLTGRDDAASQVTAVDEQNALSFECVTHRLDAWGENGLARLEPRDSAPTDTGRGCKVVPRPQKRCPRHATLPRSQICIFPTKSTCVRSPHAAYNMPYLQNPNPIGGRPLAMASREHSGVRASLPPVDADDAAEGTSRAAVTSDGLGCLKGSCAAGRPAPTPLTAHGGFATASLFEGGLAFTRRAVLGAAVAVGVSLPSMGRGGGGVAVGPAAGLEGVHSASDLASALPFPIEGEGSWAELLRRFRRIDFAKERFQEASSAKAYGPGRRPFDEQEALDERFGEVVDAADSAMLALLEAPAPDLTALAEKISLIADHRVWEMDGGEECLVWLEADARRLCSLSRR